MKYLIIITLTLGLFSCQEREIDNDASPKKENVRTSYFKNGKIKSEVLLNKDKKKDGLAKDYYENGNIHLSVHYKNGLKHGESIWYYEDGTVYRRNHYTDNLKDSIEVFYYENGEVQSEQSFFKGMYGNDLKEYTKAGKLKKKYPKLKLKQINNYHNGMIMISAHIDNGKKLIASNEELSQGKFMKVDKTDLKYASNEAIVPLIYESDEIVFETVKINAAYKTKSGRIKVISKSINIAAN